jgi:hypothetical protein
VDAVGQLAVEVLGIYGVIVAWNYVRGWIR